MAFLRDDAAQIAIDQITHTQNEYILVPIVRNHARVLANFVRVESILNVAIDIIEQTLEDESIACPEDTDGIIESLNALKIPLSYLTRNVIDILTETDKREKRS